ncbi:beta-lactamase regulator AmpE [Echinimonas agarilytica]|uniref:Beta-lactamase regulator AmpE n=1 Tax=Echinimonas agarilytica TaxID=1215918 RepID=A0AA41W4I5_9GAMM|nr:beta-lactamase regulator AmpE [Echinimonas agarilytica]MCM2678799.1 beta-lactamase regulator AmpE [Echinimonas agarilytica]
MTLLSLLIALAIERILVPSKHWQFSTYLAQYFNSLNRIGRSKAWFEQPLGVVIIAAIPALLVALLLNVIEGAFLGLLSLIVTTLIVILAMGCQQARQAYKKFLRAACRGDETACFIVAQEMGAVAPKVEGEAETAPEQEHAQLEYGVGQALTWINYRYYIAVMLWLIIFGPVGVVFYVGLRTLVDWHQDEKGNDAQVDADFEGAVQPQRSIADQVLGWLDYIPVRIASLGLTFVGNFSKAMPVWLENVFNTKDSAKSHLIRISLVAEDIDDPKNPTCVVSVTKFVEVAKRNVLLVLSFIAILTLYGSIS